MPPTIHFAPDLLPIRFTEKEMTDRFRSFQKKLEQAKPQKLASLLKMYDGGAEEEETLDQWAQRYEKRQAAKHQSLVPRRSRSTEERIRERAVRLTAAYQRRSGLQHLRKEESARLLPVIGRIPLAGPVSEAKADEIAAEMYDDQPWMGRAIDVLWRDMRVSAQDGQGLRFRPLLLDGPPSAGKTHLARRLSELTGVPDVVIDVGSGTEGFRVAGSNRTWATGTPSRVVETILEKRIGNPIVFVDEIDKAGTLHTTKGVSTSVNTSLLGLLEERSSRRWECPYFAVVFDMSRVNWILASNDVSLIPAPLRSRTRLITIEAPTRLQLMQFAKRQVHKRGLGGDDLEVVGSILSVLPDDHADLCLRGVLRIIDDLAALARRPALH
jgi:hypothetical protein